MQLVVLAAIPMMFPQAGGDKAELVRKFRAGEKLSYEFNADLRAARRGMELDTFIPDNEQFSYAFTLETEKLKDQGVADVRMKRPKFTIKLDETFDSPAKTLSEKVDHNYLFTLSKSNQVLSLKDETPKKKDKEKTGGGGGNNFRVVYLRPYDRTMQDPISSWFGQIYQLAAFVNSFDLGPILPGKPVGVGETWKQTVGYQPMQVGGGADKGKPIMGRLDYLFTFKGSTTKDGKPAVWIQATLKNESDAAPLVADWMGVKPNENPFKAIKLKINAEVNYYLDPENLQVIRIESKSDGGASVEVINYEGPVEEHKLASTASLARK